MAARRRNAGVALLVVLALALALLTAAFTPWSDDLRGPEGGLVAAPLSPSDPPALRLAAAGDVGTGGTAELATAAAMEKSAEERPFDALVLLGDNVYPSGDPARLEATVFGPFGPVLDAGAELVAVLGNHDVRQGNGNAQAAALGMPGRWYARRLGPVLLIALDSTRADDPDQRAWLEQTLAGATEEWKIVALHHPPYSAGEHGSDEQVRETFAPLFSRYGVQLVLAGHDHDYQRSVPIDGVTYVVSGGAAKLRSTGRASFTAVSWSAYHFVDVALWPDRLQLRAIGHDGLVYDEATIPRRPAGRALPVGCGELTGLASTSRRPTAPARLSLRVCWLCHHTRTQRWDRAP